MNIQIDGISKLSTAMRTLAGSLTGSSATELARAMGIEVQEETVRHLTELAGTRHETANRLGATPSNHLAQAAEKAADPSALTMTGFNEATLTINHVGLARAFHDITIVPKEKKALAIPINAIAYNKSPAQMTLEGHELFVLGGKKFDTGKNILAEKLPDGSILALFLLVASVTQRQDRSLLPSDEQWSAAAARGASTYIKKTLSEVGLA